MKTLLISIFFMNYAHAVDAEIPGCIEKTVHSVEGKMMPLCWIAKIEGWVSSDCIRKKTPECGALVIYDLALKKAMALESTDKKGGKNPATAICMKAGGKVKYATLEGGGQQTFCEAGDGSLIDSNALWNAYYANSKEKRAK